MASTAIGLMDAPACCAPLAGPALDEDGVARAAAVFRTLADPSRVRIVNLLANSDEPVCVCALMEPLGLSQPTVSHHLKRLLEAGLLARERRGTWAYYSLRRDAFGSLSSVFDMEGATR